MTIGHHTAGILLDSLTISIHASDLNIGNYAMQGREMRQPINDD